MCSECNPLNPSRRHLLVGAAASIAAATFSASFAGAAAAAEAPTVTVDPDEALKRLQEGNARYVANTATNKDFSAGRMARAAGQAPFAAILGCADSRVAPELAFDQGPGELFVTRVAGNFANEDGIATLEYGVAVLGVRLIMVLGHASCGAVEATIKVVKDGTQLPGHLPSLVDAIRPAVDKAMAAKPDDLLAAATLENVRQNVAYLLSVEPIIAEAVKAGKIKVVGAVYDIATGKVTPV